MGQSHVDEVIGTDEGHAKDDKGDGCRYSAGASPYIGKRQAATNTREQQHRQPSEQLCDTDEDGTEQSHGGQEEQVGKDGECVNEGSAERCDDHQGAEGGATAESAQSKHESDRVDETWLDRRLEEGGGWPDSAYPTHRHEASYLGHQYSCARGDEDHPRIGPSMDSRWKELVRGEAPKGPFREPHGRQVAHDAGKDAENSEF